MMVWRSCSEKHAMVKAKDHQWIVTMKLEVRPMIRIVLGERWLQIQVYPLSQRSVTTARTTGLTGVGANSA